MGQVLVSVPGKCHTCYVVMCCKYPFHHPVKLLAQLLHFTIHLLEAQLGWRATYIAFYTAAVICTSSSMLVCQVCQHATRSKNLTIFLLSDSNQMPGVVEAADCSQQPCLSAYCC